MAAPFDGTRPQAPNLPDPEALRPPSAPGDTFGGAPRPVEDNRLKDLASSLGAFNSNLEQFGHAYNIAQRYHKNTGEMDAARQYVNTRTPDEFAADAKAGKIPQFATPQAQTYVGVTQGTYAAEALGKEVQEKVGTGELKWGDGSAQNYMQQRRGEILQQNGWDENSYQARGFGSHFNTLWQSAGKQGVNANVEAQNYQLKQAANTNIESVIDAAQKQGLDPAATWAKIDEARKTAVSYGHFEPKELDPMIFDALNRRMATDPNWVMGVGGHPRTDLTDPSKTVPPLFSKAEYMSQAENMRQRTQTFNVNAETQKQKDTVNNGVDQILNGDNPAALHNVPEKITATNSVDGSRVEVTKTTAVAQAASATIARDNQRLALGQATPAQVEDEQLTKFSQAGIKHQPWSDELDGAAHGASSVSLTQPTQQANALAAYQRYTSLRAKNPAYLNTLMDGPAKRFFNTAYLQQTLFGKDPITAMQSSAAIWGTPKTEEENRALADQRRNLENVGASLNWGGWFDRSIKNPQIGKDAMIDAAWSLVRLNGYKPEDAVKAAKDIALNHFVPVNGQLVPDLHFLPKEQMQPAAEGYLRDWATGPAASLHLDPKNLSIMPVGPSQFVITDASNGMPIVTPKGMNYVNVPDLISGAQKYVQRQKAEADAAASGQQNWADKNLRPGERPGDNPDANELARRAAEAQHSKQDREKWENSISEAEKPGELFLPTTPTPYKPANVPQSEKQRYEADQRRRRDLLGIGPKPEGN